MATIQKIGLIGCGNMGSALISGLCQQGYSPAAISVSDHHADHTDKLHAKWPIILQNNNQELTKSSEILILAVKPAGLKSLIEEIRPAFDPRKTLLISLAAGITTQQMTRWMGLQGDLPIVRAMPNTPALINLGMTGLFATEKVNELQKTLTENLFKSVGETIWLPTEAQMDVVTALSGSGPAYFFYFIEGLQQAAMQLGLSPAIALKLSLQTALGSATLASESTEELAELRNKVTSVGGTTEQGIRVLKDAKLADILASTLSAATERARAISHEYSQ